MAFYYLIFLVLDQFQIMNVIRKNNKRFFSLNVSLFLFQMRMRVRANHKTNDVHVLFLFPCSIRVLSSILGDGKWFKFEEEFVTHTNFPQIRKSVNKIMEIKKYTPLLMAYIRDSELQNVLQQVYYSFGGVLQRFDLEIGGSCDF